MGERPVSHVIRRVTHRVLRVRRETLEFEWFGDEVDGWWLPRTALAFGGTVYCVDPSSSFEAAVRERGCAVVSFPSADEALRTKPPIVCLALRTRTVTELARMWRQGYRPLHFEGKHWTFLRRGAVLVAPDASIVVTHRRRGRTRALALTFDDGPALWTEPILDLLARHRARATFFVIGDAIPGREMILRRAHAEGHEVGNHTLTHRPLDTLSPEEVARELDATTELIERTLGAPPRVLRPPGFRYNATVLQVAAREGFPVVVNASVVAGDWAIDSPEEIAEAVLARAQPGSIVTLHDGRPPHELPGTSRPDRSPTVTAVGMILNALQTRRYKLVTVSELLDLR